MIWLNFNESTTLQDFQNVIVGVLTNDEIKRRIRNIFSQFVSEVQPTLLTDRLIQRKVITNDRWERIRQENPTPKSQCEALLTYLLSIQHPRAFVIIWKALHEHGHFLLKSIDNQESEQANQTAILGEYCLQLS